ncbi:MAG: NAD(P)/FAD-dependent oxidoreductase [Clostridia bacterium]|nr:NAD(P)/FAD-dependent oxidoreductase [Clostridia bacterium]
MKYDVLIIGAGVTGCAVARWLSQYDASVCVLEKEEDVCCGTSKANSAILHAGFDAKHGTLMAKLNVRGSEMAEALSKELDFSYDRCGSLVVCLSEEDRPRLIALYENGVKNGVKGLEIIERDRLIAMEPNVSDSAVAALWAPTGAIVCPFEMTLAFAENAAENGTTFCFDTAVQSLVRTDAGWRVETDRGVFEAKAIVNAAGVYADVFHNAVCDKPIHITPRRGDYCLLDHAAEGFVRHTVFQLPGIKGKGVLVSPTVHGNVIVGPTAIDVDDREGTNTTADGLNDLMQKAGMAVKNLPLRQTITSFAGLRAHEDGHEFIVQESAPDFFDCAGIESPGLSSAPAIGEMAAGLLWERYRWTKKPDWNPTRRGILDPKTLSTEEWNALIQKEPAYGQIICRCESVTEGEILDAIRRPLGARSLDGVKRRTRAGMGRCQAGFCSPRVMEILSRERNVPLSEITKNGKGSELIVGTAKDVYREVRDEA